MGRRTRSRPTSRTSSNAGTGRERNKNDGSFGITGECKEITSEEVELLEKHKFEDIRNIFWRNSYLDFRSINNLIKTLEEKPNKDWLRRISECEDEKVLKYLIKDNELKIEEKSEEIKLLWECCQIPDFVKKNIWTSF